MPFPLTEFYRGYLVDYFPDKQGVTVNIIEKYEKLSPDILQGLERVDHEKLIYGLKVEVRATLFQAIEALFELVFALEPRDGVVNQEEIWLLMASSNWKENNRRITEIGEGDVGFLEATIPYSGNWRVPFAQFLFFFGKINDEYQEDVFTTCQAIPEALSLLAREYSDRGEYNAYKHGLRFLHRLGGFGIGTEPDMSKLPFMWDMRESVTYPVVNAGGFTEETRPLDYQRDRALTNLCGMLISNIVLSRRKYFFPEDDCQLYMFDARAVRAMNERHLNWGKLSFRITPHQTKPPGVD